jgi:hypothetical protein
MPAALTRSINQLECVHGPSTHVIIFITSGVQLMGTKCTLFQHKLFIYRVLQNFYIEVITFGRLGKQLPFWPR